MDPRTNNLKKANEVREKNRLSEDEKYQHKLDADRRHYEKYADAKKARQAALRKQLWRSPSGELLPWSKLQNKYKKSELIALGWTPVPIS